jgi:hypothetical protein
VLLAQISLSDEKLMVFLAAVQIRGLKMAGVRQRWNHDPKSFDGLWKMEFSESP